LLVPHILQAKITEATLGLQLDYTKATEQFWIPKNTTAVIRIILCINLDAL
jgi:hypothetical protein